MHRKYEKMKRGRQPWTLWGWRCDPRQFLIVYYTAAHGSVGVLVSNCHGFGFQFRCFLIYVSSCLALNFPLPVFVCFLGLCPVDNCVSLVNRSLCIEACVHSLLMPCVHTLVLVWSLCSGFVFSFVISPQFFGTFLSLSFPCFDFGFQLYSHKPHPPHLLRTHLVTVTSVFMISVLSSRWYFFLRNTLKWSSVFLPGCRTYSLDWTPKWEQIIKRVHSSSLSEHCSFSLARPMWATFAVALLRSLV